MLREFKDFIVVKKPRTDTEDLGDFNTIEEARAYKKSLKEQYAREGWSTDLGIIQIIEG